jgi:hypothetical protein
MACRALDLYRVIGPTSRRTVRFVVVRSPKDSLQAFDANHTALLIRDLFLILEFASKEGLWFPSLTIKGAC